MSVSYQQARKQRVRITLDLQVFNDFNARDIDFEKLFKLEPDESVDVYVEEFDRYWVALKTSPDPSTRSRKTYQTVSRCESTLEAVFKYI